MFIANYDDGHYVPDYGASLVTPTTHYKVYNATSGRYWGGCFACHQDTTVTDPDLFDSYDTHHTATNGQGTGALDHQGDRTPGVTCNWCHTTYWNTTTNSERPIGYPDELKFEIRNNTLLSVGDAINGTGCEKCHDVGTIHNIQKDYGSGTAGKGHIETNWDCNGCHAYWDAGESGFENVIVPSVYSITTDPAKLTTGAGFTITVTGSGFLSGTTTNPIQASVEIDGVSYSGTVTDTTIVATIPGLTEGVHTVKVKKTGDYDWQTKYSGELSIVVVDPVDATSATLVKTGHGLDTVYTITVSGSGFGDQPPAEFTELGVTVATSVRGQPVTYTLAVSSWSDAQIVGTVTSAVVGDPVTVNALFGSDTVTLTQG
ncbi:IPT/TIG domain-containing protein [Candidatus Methanoperedens nitratireducens]|uniref:Putative Cytochrome c n=1 Tax=Candidatus Methanoperedens nitratireducens TaxID=1392998 RepID=A0A284VP44_9EURY|nr:IPT/TIG domain-containing protein [Candidatus Methanoperedens nitroreducens]SNQ60989.1 putative Cytochrome c [Candidatus Methanoperedens nitroreducens]